MCVCVIISLIFVRDDLQCVIVAFCVSVIFTYINIIYVNRLFFFGSSFECCRAEVRMFSEIAVFGN